MNLEASSVLESASRRAVASATRALPEAADGADFAPAANLAADAHLATGPDLDAIPPPSRDAALARFLYPAPAQPRTVGSIFKWWERRRPAYNLVVGTGGMLTMALATVLSQLMGEPVAVSQLLAPVIPIAIMANVCYTLGPLTESLLHKLWGREVLPVGPHLFRAGLVLSVGVMFLIPTLLMGFGLVLWILGFG